jgi:hypothetical protein
VCVCVCACVRARAQSHVRTLPESQGVLGDKKTHMQVC